MRALLAVLLGTTLALAPSFPAQTRALPDAATFKPDVPAIFEVIWFESLLTAFSGAGSAASPLRHYTYSEYDTVYLKATGTTYRLGPYHAIGTQNKRVWFQEFTDELRNSEVERQDRDKQTLLARIERALEIPAGGLVDVAAEDADLVAGCDIRVLQRESIGNRDVLLLAVKAIPNYRPKTAIGGLGKRFDLQVWIDEERHDVVKLEAQLLAPIYLDLIFREGAAFRVERQSFGRGQWLPSKTEVTIPKFGRMTVNYEDFKRFTTDVILKVGEPVAVSPQP